MHNRQRTWTRLAAALSFVVGLILVLNGSGAGWVFFMIGISYFGISTRAGQPWAASNPSLARLGLIGVALLLVLLLLLLLLLLVVGAVFLLK